MEAPDVKAVPLARLKYDVVVRDVIEEGVRGIRTWRV
jgi:hypothetical protein